MDCQTWGAFLPLSLIGGALVGGIVDFGMTPKAMAWQPQRIAPVGDAARQTAPISPVI